MSGASHNKRIARRLTGVFVLLVSLCLSRGVDAERVIPDAIYVPTPQALVDTMLEWARVGPDDFLIDLGSGDGRIPITAAKRFGARGFGVDIDPARVEEATAIAKAAGVADRVKFEVRDLFETDISKASVLTLYLSLSINGRLRERILDALSPGSRVLSHAFDMGAWVPDRVGQIEGRMLYLWIVPAKVGGNWHLREDRTDQGQQVVLKLDQSFQKISGKVSVNGRSSPLREVGLEGDRLSFEAVLDDGRAKRFEGRLVNGRLEGSGWQAARSLD